jgi:hypothetical protein
MSDALSKFVSEYNATGRKKLDGYTLSYLDSLTGDERQQATDMLREETIRNGAGIYTSAKTYLYAKVGLIWVMQLLSGDWFGLPRNATATFAEQIAAGTSGFRINEIWPTAGTSHALRTVSDSRWRSSARNRTINFLLMHLTRST